MPSKNRNKSRSPERTRIVHNYEDEPQHPRHVLQEPYKGKTCYFYRDGDTKFKAVKICVHPRKYYRIETLISELSTKVRLPFGVRSIFTPHGQDMITSLDMLENNESYICSPHRQQARGLDPNSVVPPPTWHYEKPSSGTKEFNRLLREYAFQNRARVVGNYPRDQRMAEAYNRTQPKKITVLKNGEPTIRHVVLINRRTAQTFEQILSDLSGMFAMAVRKLYTMEGRPITSLVSMINGPDVLVAGGQEPFRSLVGYVFEPMDRESRARSRVDTHSRIDMQSRMDMASIMDHSNDKILSKMKKRRDRNAKTRGQWKVWCTTSQQSVSGTSAQVTITVYGLKGNSGPLPLGFPDNSYFLPGQVDEFDIDVGKDLGEIYKIRLSHDNTGDSPGWLCEEIRMQDVDTEEILVFPCRKWLSREEGDNEISREIPAQRTGEPQLPVIKYEVTVVTGDLWNGGTHANVYLTIYGDRGDSGTRQLYVRQKGQAFNKGQTNHFTVEAVSLGHLKRVIVGHDGTAAGDGWFLEKLSIQEPDAKPHEVYQFYCGRWLDAGEDDGKIVRELKVMDDYMEDILEKRNWEYEKWKFESKNHVMLFSMLTGKALRIKTDGSVDGLGEDSFPGSTLIVSSKKPMVRVFASFQNSNYHLVADQGKIAGVGRGGPQCEFRIHVQSDRTVMLEAAKSPLQFITLQENGKLGESRSILDKDPAKRFHVYARGVLRHKGIIMLRTSNTQAISVDHDKSVYATGRCNRAAHFRVHKVDQGGLRMFESMIYPGFYLRFKDGKFDCGGSRNEDSHFSVVKHKNKGYFTLQFKKQPMNFVGFTPQGDVRPTIDSGNNNIHIYPEVIEFGISKNQLTNEKLSPISERPGQDEESDARRKTKSEIDEGDHNVMVSTAESLDNGQVSLTVFGERGSSGPIMLSGPNDNGPLFRAGTTDNFKINLAKLGKLHKVRLELLPRTQSKDPSWKVQKLTLTDLYTQEKYIFNFDRWLSREKEDQDLVRELPVVRDGQTERSLPVVKYYVTVYTGRDPGSETNAPIYINMFGDLGDSGKRQLRVSNKAKAFQRGQSDTFELEAVHLGNLHKIQIGHDETKPGDGWFCEKVVIREGKTANMEFVFPCGRWFDANMEDRKLERTLMVQEPAPSKISYEDASNRQVYKEDVKVLVSTHPNSGTMLDTVILYFYGKDGVVTPLKLGSGRDGLFKPGATDELKLVIGQKMENVYKVRVGLTEEYPGSDWHLEKLKIKGLTSGNEFDFDVGRWMSRKKEDCEVCRELPVARFDEPPLPVVTYTVEVHTSDLPGADTEAPVYITLIGQRGDTGKRRLYVTQTTGKMFSQGKIDSFILEAVSLGSLKSVVIGHAEKRPGAGWHLAYVAVKELDHNDVQMETFFPCDKWLDAGQSDGLTERQLLPGQRPKTKKKSGKFALSTPMDNPRKHHMWMIQLGTRKYRLWVTTARDSQPSNGGKAVLVVYGDQGCSQDIDLFAPNSTAKLFEPGNSDEFEVSTGDIGEIYKIRITREDKPEWRAWHLNEVRLQEKTTKETYTFTFDRWISNDTEDGDLTRELPVMREGRVPLAVKTYEVKVATGDHWAAETEANVHITLYGSNGDSGKRLLHRSRTGKKKFQRGTVNIFTVEAVDLKTLTSVLVGHDGKGQGAGWFLKHVILTDLSSARSEKYVFPCGRWLDDGEDDGKTERKLRTVGLLNLSDPRPVPADCGGRWKVKVRTSDIQGADSRAQIYMTVQGTKENSKPIPFKGTSSFTELFRQGKETEFDVTVGKIGEITKIRLEPDSKSPNPSWHVDWVLMKHLDTGYDCLFTFDRWLAEDREDGQRFRECALETPGWMPAPVLRYILLVKTGRQPNSGAHGGMCSINLIGSQGDTGQQLLSRPLNTLNDQMKDGIVDVYMLEAVCLGQLRNITLAFDGQGKAKRWFVESVKVRESLSALTESVFIANCWMDDEKNKAVTLPCSETGIASYLPSGVDNALLGHEIPDSKGRWDIWIWTGSQQGGGTQDVITLVLYGTTGPSTPFLLNREQDFYAGSMVQTKIETSNIGELFKIRLAFAEKNGRSSWFLERIKLKDADTNQEFSFDFSNWVQPTEDNQSGMVELAAIRPDLVPLSVMNYKISVTTGDMPCSETSAEVNLMLIGQWGDSGQHFLNKPKNNRESFKRGQVDEFEMNLLDLGKISKILIGHSEHGRGRGWFCQQVSILATGPNGEKSETVFDCNRWLDTGVDDRKTSREFSALGTISLKDVISSSSRFASHGIWTCYLKMAAMEKLDISKPSQNTLQQVSITVYGTKGLTGPIELGEGKVKFAPGQVYTLKGLKFRDIGDLVKLRVSAGVEDDKRTTWIIEEIILEDETSHERLKFDFVDYIGEIGGDTNKERPVVRPGVRVSPVVKYNVRVITNDFQGAGTAAKVYMNLHGTKGDSGRRLLHTQEGLSPYRQGQEKEFEIEAVDLGELKRIVVTKGPGDPWMLSHVVVKAGQFGSVENNFLCKSWIGSSSKRDQEAEITLNVVSIRPSNVVVPTTNFPDFPVTRGQWFVEAITGRSGLTEDSSDILIVFCGNKKESSPLDLKPKGNNPFQPGQKDKIKLSLSDDVGELIKMRLGFKDNSHHKSWHLQEIKFEDHDTRDTFWFAFNDFLAVNDTSDGWREFPVIWPGVFILPIIKYSITVTTGDIDDAGTRAQVLIKMDGQMGSTGYRMLKDMASGHVKFQRGQTDRFVIEAVSLLSLKSVTVGHTNMNPGSGWFLEKLVVRPNNEERDYLFTCNRWFDAGHDDGETFRTLTLNEDGNTTVTNTPKTARPVAARLPEEKVMKPTLTVPLGDRGKPPKPESPPDNRGKPPSPQLPPRDRGKPLSPVPPAEKKKPPRPVSNKAYTYNVTTVTGAESNHGTNKPLVLILYGINGHTEPLVIGKGEKSFALKQGETEHFEISTDTDVGEIYKVRIGFDSKGKEKEWYSNFNLCPSWFGKMLKLREKKSQRESYFDLNQWIKMEADHDYWREFPVRRDNASQILPVKDYYVDVYTGDQAGSGTYANVFIKIFGIRGDTGWRHLHGSKTNISKFQAGYHDVFRVEAVDLGELSHVKVKHDGRDPDSGWYLKNIKIKDSQDPKLFFFFDCERWFDEGKEDGAIERTLLLTAVSPVEEFNPIENGDEDSGEDDDTGRTRVEDPDVEDNRPKGGSWKVTTKTSKEPGSGTDANVTLTVFGNTGDSGPLVLGEKGKEYFEPGRTDQFDIWLDPDEIGTIRKIRLQHDNSGQSPEWRVDQLLMENTDTREKHKFDINRWLSHKEIDGDIVYEGAVDQPDLPALTTCSYIVKTVTEAEEESGTEANVYINIIGTQGDTGKRFLKNDSSGHDRFLSGQTNYFIIEAIDIGDIEKIVLGHDGTEPGSAWKPLCVMVRKEDSVSKETCVFPCGKWLSGHEREIIIKKGKMLDDDDDDGDEQEEKPDDDEEPYGDENENYDEGIEN
ncbi:unnamed protein product [Lymnaea stagnalis]|uniref:Lipoxygenase homology domain-containing protein 1 n=1 Tax=Lymnaea stagnalis TaxID=6523 RepID=A0AAV2I2S6_LYMST